MEQTRDRANSSIPYQDSATAWRWLVAIGIVIMLIGVFALATAMMTTLLSVLFIGLLFVAAAIFQAIFAVTAGRWSGFGLHLLLAVLYGITGVFILGNPAMGMVSLTLFLAFLFVVSGMFRIIASATFRFPYWGLSLASGLITAALGIYVAINLNKASLFLLGTLFGVDLIFFGAYLASFGANLRHLEKSGRIEQLRSAYT
jgi:uncharacterized membrane protein HdeD (DUF308 family)